MSKKSLLNENTIRRFMKLASIGPLTEDFVDKQQSDQPEEEIEEGYGMPAARDEEPLEDLPAPEGEVPEELPEVEPEEEVPGLEPEVGEGTDLGLSPEAAEEVAEKLASGFAEVVQDALGVEGLLSVEKEGEGEGEMDLGAEEELPPLEGEEEAFPPAGEEGLPPTEEEPVMQESVINELAKRVTKRLMQQGREKKVKEKYPDTLSEQIVDRIFSSSKTK